MIMNLIISFYIACGFELRKHILDWMGDVLRHLCGTINFLPFGKVRSQEHNHHLAYKEAIYIILNILK